MNQAKPVDAARFADNLDKAGRILVAWSDGYNLPAILTTPAGDLIWANASAIALLDAGDHLRVRGDRLICTDSSQDGPFRDMLASLKGDSALWICRGQNDHLLVRAERIQLDQGEAAIGINLFSTVVAKRNYQWGDFGELFGLTAAEVEVAKQLVGGDRAEEVAQTLAISVETVRTHVRRIYGKLGINSREQLFSMISVFRTH